MISYNPQRRLEKKDKLGIFEQLIFIARMGPITQLTHKTTIPPPRLREPVLF